MSENTMPEVVTSETPALIQNKKEKKPKRRRLRGRFWRTVRKVIKWLLIVAILLVAGLFALKAYITTQASSGDKSSAYSRSAVQVGAMSDTVYGTGTTSAKNQPNIIAEADGTLTDLRVTIGDSVKAGDVIAVITNDELDDTITDYEFALWELDDTIQDTSAGANVLSVRAPIAGRVMALYGEVGEDTLAVFRREGKLAVISTDGRMKVVVSDVPASAGVKLGDSVQVKGEDFEIEGTVSDLTLQGTQATVTILDDTLPMGAQVTVCSVAGDVLGSGALEVNKPMEVSAYGGTISAVRAKVGQKVERKDILFGLEDSPLTLTMENLRLQREAAAKDLEDAKAQRESLIVLAPCDGIVASLAVSEGDAITSGTVVGSILQGEDMKLTIAVDELDVVDVEIGQNVTITIDALSDLELGGEVYKVAPVGSNSGGVTTYDVELAFDAAGTGVRSGMNATGEIQIASKSSAMYVPVEAIMTINNQTYVMVEDGGTQTLSSAAQSTDSTNRRSQMGGMGQFPGGAERGERGGSSSGMPQGMDFGSMPQMPEGMDFGSMPDMAGGFDMSQLPEGFTPGSMPQMPGSESAAQETEEGFSVQRVIDMVTEKARSAYERVMAWLYEDVELNADTVTGSLVAVEVGMQNDDYAEILSGLSIGQTVLYTATTENSSSSFSFGGMGGMGGMSMPGMGGGPMGF